MYLETLQFIFLPLSAPDLDLVIQVLQSEVKKIRNDQEDDRGYHQ